MLKIVQEFFITFIELTIIMILWSKFFLKENNNWFKNVFIMAISAFIAVMLSYTKLYYDMIIVYFSIILLVKFVYKRSLIKTLLEFLVIACMSILLQAVNLVIINLIGSKYSDNFMINMTCLLIDLFLVILTSFFISHKKTIETLNLDNNALYYFIVNLGVYVILSKLIWEKNKNLILNNLFIFILIFSLIVILSLSLYSYIVKITEEKKTLEVQDKYNPILTDIIEDIRRRQHDFKNYLNTINGIVEVTSEKEIKHELKKYIKSVNSSNRIIEDIMHIDNIVIKSIIYNKLCEADRLNIKFSFNIRNNSLDGILNDYEISDILNNLLNNAFEEVKKDSDKDKIVILNILTEENKSILEVRNTGTPILEENINNIFKRGFSTKKGKNRGYGLYNIKKIVERNGGKVQLFFEDNYTVFRVSFK
ncbi:sensor histidine kinase [Clostridium sp. ZS2-4]|uniref:sensor histidine kinase n=1 Tax=Clostridium sp. ZS2-4 TaxID=2987703 RepID=UPI00227BD7BB|nr:GHKL domain-containing protein [Clostridium sp. ZS2-4]MCY6355220.1 GHKL domain-containing protein [Clostridium sp. ZS2-4]